MEKQQIHPTSFSEASVIMKPKFDKNIERYVRG